MTKKIISTNAEISSQNTKAEILAAYQEAMGQLEGKRIDDPVTEKKKTDEAAVVVKATQHSQTNILADLTNLKGNLIKEIDRLSGQMVDEFNRLTEIKQAIVIEQQHIKDLYEIEDTAKTLSALILAQEKQQGEFAVEMQAERDALDKEMAEKQVAWQEQQENLSNEYKELKAQLEKDRKREEDDYNYKLDTTRRKEVDAYTEKKANLEKELAVAKQQWQEREAALQAKEKEFVTLKQQVENFTKDLARIKEETEKQIKAQLEMQFKQVTLLRDKEIEGERKLNEHKISVLEQKIREQEQLILQLTQKADLATNQIQAIACRALDTSAQRFNPAACYQDDKPGKETNKGQ